MALSMDKLFLRQYKRSDGEILKINQCEIGDVGCVVWDAALVLTAFLESEYFSELCNGCIRRKRVIELGAGTGVVGIQAACEGFDCIITDLPDFVPLMNLNIETNQKLFKGNIKASVLTWGKDDHLYHSPDVLLLADCIYYEESIDPLVTTIRNLSSHNTLVLCCYEERMTCNKPELQSKFFEMIRQDFDVAEVPLEKQDPLYHSDDIHIMIFRKKSQDLNSH